MTKLLSVNPKLDSLTIDIRLSRRFKIRVWLGLNLMKLGTWILGANINVDRSDPPSSGACSTCDVAMKANTAAELLRRMVDEIDISSRGSAGRHLPCGCIDVCTDQRPGHPSAQSKFFITATSGIADAIHDDGSDRRWMAVPPERRYTPFDNQQSI